MPATVEFTSKRSGRTYEMRELNSLQSADAFAFLPGSTVHARTVMAIINIDGVVQQPITSPVEMRRALERIPESDLDLAKYHYDKAFAVTADDLGNESKPDGSQPSS